MTLLTHVDLKFILEAPNVIGMVPVTMGLQASRIDSTILSMFFNAACGHLVPVPQNVDKLRSATDPADQGIEKTDNPGSESKSRSQKIVKKTKGSSKTMQCPYCEDVMNTRVIHGHCRNRHQAKYDPGYVTRYIKGGPAVAGPPPSAAAADLPEGPGPSSSDPNETLTGPYVRTNMHVKQVKAINGKKHDGIGVVQGRKGNMVEVQFGSGKYDRLPDVCLEAV